MASMCSFVTATFFFNVQFFPVNFLIDVSERRSCEFWELQNREMKFRELPSWETKHRELVSVSKIDCTVL